MNKRAPSPFILNAFEMSTVSHITFGLWRHPEDRTADYVNLSYWTELAQLLDAGGFDALFIADAVGQLDVYGGSAAAALSGAAQTPVTDPLLAVSAMAAVTEHLGFGITVSTTYEYPYLLARKFTTLDHLTKGRIAWNVVTSLLDSAARNIIGRDRQLPHDIRYDSAQEFIDVTYKLWEGSWEEGAVRRDRESGIFTDPAKVHPIGHRGTYFTVPSAHLSEPSPQRTPLIFQAGTSDRGKDFAARNAEVVFLGAPRPDLVRKQVDDIRARARALGRRPGSIKFIASLLAIADETDAAAQAKLADLRKYYSVEGALVLFSAGTGVDWSRHDLDTPLEYLETDSSRSALLSYTRWDPARKWTLRDIFSGGGVGGLGQQTLIAGSGKTVADRLEAYADEAGLDGFNLSYALMPGTFQDFADHVVPELRRRGRVRDREAGQTLRQRIFGAESSYLPDDHPGSAYRRDAPTWPATGRGEPGDESGAIY